MQYLLNLERFLGAFDTLRPDVFGFACTGSSYLLGAEEEQRFIDSAQARFWLSDGDRGTRDHLGARAPGCAAHRSDRAVPGVRGGRGARQYWSAAGIEVRHPERIALRTADTRGVYELQSDRLVAALRRVALMA